MLSVEWSKWSLTNTGEHLLRNGLHSVVAVVGFRLLSLKSICGRCFVVLFPLLLFSVHLLHDHRDITFPSAAVRFPLLHFYINYICECLSSYHISLGRLIFAHSIRLVSSSISVRRLCVQSLFLTLQDFSWTTFTKWVCRISV